MGGGNWTSKDWSSYSASRGITGQSTVDSLYVSKKIKENLNPKGINFRESCDSTSNPQSTPIIVGLDVTGSMGDLAETIAKDGLNTLMIETYNKKPVTDPQIMFMAIGDAFSDDAPLQVSQFESDIRIAEQLLDIYFEGRGGGNGGESYLLSWYFAARHTKIDSFDKHGKKGFIFTIGDEPNHDLLTVEQIQRIFGDNVEKNLTAEELLVEVSRMYEVFHLVVKDGERRHNSVTKWGKLLGERTLEVLDHTKIPEIIESTMELISGKDIDSIIKQWDGSTSITVQRALNGLSIIDSNNSLVEF